MICNCKHRVVLMGRHGSTEFNEEGIFKGWDDIELDSNGLREASNMGWFVYDYPVVRIIHSGLRRAKQTAEIISDILGLPIYGEDIRLRAWNVGYLSGQLKADKKDDIDFYTDNPDEAIPEGESLNTFKDRVAESIAEYTEWGESNGLLLLVTHNSYISSANEVIIGCDDDEDEGITDAGTSCVLESKGVLPGGVCEVSVDGEGYTVSPIWLPKDVQ